MDNFYRLVNDKYPQDIIFGIDTDNKLLIKLNKGLSLIKPWKHGVPNYNDSCFCFKSLNALCTFLFILCKLTKNDIYELSESGWYIDYLKLSTYSSGMSSIWCNYDPEDVIESKHTDITDYIDTNYCTVSYKTYLNKDEIYYCYNRYYSDIKTYY